MKIGLKNKWRKVVHGVSTDSSTDAYYWGLMWNYIDGLTIARSIKNYDFHIWNSA